MKKMLFVLMALCLVSSLAFAAEDAVTAAATTTDTAAAVIAPEVAAADMPAVTAASEMMMKGDIIDNMCAGANKDKISEFVKTHTKECALQPACIESGYSIFADGKLYAFDKASSAKIAEFLEQADSKLQVAITAKQVGDELSLASIENQK